MSKWMPSWLGYRIVLGIKKLFEFIVKKQMMIQIIWKRHLMSDVRNELTMFMDSFCNNLI